MGVEAQRQCRLLPAIRRRALPIPCPILNLTTKVVAVQPQRLTPKVRFQARFAHPIRLRRLAQKVAVAQPHFHQKREK
jgi:hypothetical protein